MRIYRLPEVLRITGLSRASIYRLLQAGDFPSSVRLTARSIGWHSKDIETWIAARAATSKDQGDD